MDQYLKGKICGVEICVSALCAMTYLYMCKRPFLAFAGFFSIPASVVTVICYVGVIFAFTVYTLSDRKNICLDGIVVIVTAVLFFWVSLLVHPEYSVRFEDAYHLGKHSAKSVFAFGSGIYCYYIFRLFEDKEQKLYDLYKFVAFTILFFEIWAMFDRSGEDYDMSFGYQMEMAAILFIMIYFEERKLLYLLLSLFAMATGVLYGSRACILGYIAFVIVYFIWKGELNNRQLLVISLGVLAVITYKSRTVIRMIYDLFASVGLRSRTLYYIAKGDVLEVDRARQDDIWPTLIYRLKEMPIFKIYGAYGDRYFLKADRAYAHNFLLEILLTFGYIIGGIILIWLLVQFVRVIRRNKDIGGLMTIAFGCYSMCRLMFSSTIWEDPYFWTFIAMLVNCAKNRYRGERWC